MGFMFGLRVRGEAVALSQLGRPPMNLRDENYDRLHRIAKTIPDSAIADTINAYRGTSFTGDQIKAVREFDAMAQKQMMLSKTQETAFKQLVDEINSAQQTDEEDVKVHVNLVEDEDDDE